MRSLLLVLAASSPTLQRADRLARSGVGLDKLEALWAEATAAAKSPEALRRCASSLLETVRTLQALHRRKADWVWPDFQSPPTGREPPTAWPELPDETCDTDELKAFAKMRTDAAGIAQMCQMISDGYDFNPPQDWAPYNKWSASSWKATPLCAQHLFTDADCAAVLHYYEPLVVMSRSDLPAAVLEPVLSTEKQAALLAMTKATIGRLNEKGARNTVLFGTLLAMTRPGHTMMPWDDDVDFGLDKNDVDKFLDGLQEVHFSDDVVIPYHHTERKPDGSCRGDKDKLYQLSTNPDLLLLHKEWGVPLKVVGKNSSGIYDGYPSIDIYTFEAASGVPECDVYSEQTGLRPIDCDPDNVVIPKKQLQHGHLKKFSQLALDFYPLEKGTFSIAGETFDVSMVGDPMEVSRACYGDDAVESCVTTRTHGSTKVQNVKFPCSFLQPELPG